MAGIYIHIPFCRQKCYYCDFFKTVNTSQTEQFIAAIKKELILRKNYLGNEPVDTIYFGGGTPSVLNEKQLTSVLAAVASLFTINKHAEITIESNPDDLTAPYLKMLQKAGINRLSIGIQSFQDKHLKKMNRRHNTIQAKAVVKQAAELGFSNISVDLIYGLPNLTQQEWETSLEEVFSLPVQHLSAYHLTYHEGTPFYTWLKKGTLQELKEEESVSQFNLLMEKAESAGFEQYEISNFAKNELYSRHNSSYWNGSRYLGIGPSAHSYNGNSRQWNVAHLDAYLKGIESDSVYFQEEILSKNEKYNDYIITRLRTKWGVSSRFIGQQFGKDKKRQFLQDIGKYVDSGKIIQQDDTFQFSREGLFVSDDIMANLVII